MYTAKVWAEFSGNDNRHGTAISVSGHVISTNDGICFS